MVLAAGFGTRLRPLTEELPKPLVPVANHPLIAWSLALLASAGVERVAVNLHHLGAAIEQALGDGSSFGLRIIYSPEDPILGTGGGVARMRPFLEDGTFFLVNGDVLCGVDLEAVLRFHRAQRAVSTMVVRPYPPGARFTPLEMDEAGWMVGFKGARRPPRGRTRPVMFCGVHVIEPVVFDYLPREGFSCINDHAVCRMIEDGRDVAAWLEAGPWYDLGTPAAYLQANRDLAAGRVCLDQLAPGGTLRPDAVLLDEDVTVETGVQLGPEVVCGADCAIGAGARVSRSVLWPGARIAPGERLDQMIVSPRHRVQGFL